MLRRDAPHTLLHELRKVPAVWRMAPYYWGPVDLVNFLIVPLRLRPLYSACGYIPWSMFLTTMANDFEATSTSTAAIA